MAILTSSWYWTVAIRRAQPGCKRTRVDCGVARQTITESRDRNMSRIRSQAGGISAVVAVLASGRRRAVTIDGSQPVHEIGGGGLGMASTAIAESGQGYMFRTLPRRIGAVMAGGTRHTSQRGMRHYGPQP